MAKYLPELSSLLDSLDNYSICERHYNQVIVKKSFVKQLTKLDDSSFSDSDEVERKRRKLTDNNDEMQVCEKSFSDFGVQVSMQDPVYETLSKRNSELEGANNRQLLLENEALKRLLDERLADEQDRVRLVMEIAKMERRNVYDDIINLLKNHNFWISGVAEKGGIHAIATARTRHWCANRRRNRRAPRIRRGCCNSARPGV